MNVPRFISASLAAGVVLNVLDFVVHGRILSGPFYSRLTSLFRSDAPMAGLIIGDFVAAVVLVWVYDRVYSSFAGGLKGGTLYGLYAGVLVNFPTWIFFNMLFVGFPYKLAWIWTIYGIVASVILGGVAGAIYKK